jgi:hypothetical protein
VVPIKAHPFDLKQVRLLDGPFQGAMARNRRYLHDLEPDRLLHVFRVNAGLPSAAEPLGGWEKPDCEVRGHFVGHYLSACALTYAATGDEELKQRADAMVAELARCQEALGGGYLSAFPETFIGRAEARERVWAPYYTLHKLFAGMIDMYAHCGNAQALDVARGMAAWAKRRCDGLEGEGMQRMLDRTEQGGMNDTLANLYAVTGDPEHLALARRFDQKSYVEPLVAGRDELRGKHANSMIPNIVGSAREYELTGDEDCRAAAEFFWEQVVGRRSYVTGGTSNHEHWRTGPGVLDGELSERSHETCCTHNMLKLTRHLFGWSADPRHADYYERALYNGILATQNPEDGMTMYYVPMESGWRKTFSRPLDSFWCCTGTGIESHAKYGDSIYFHDDDGVFVNLFIASELDWPERGVRIRQETRFPEQEATSLIIRADRPVELALRIRVPYWATRGVTVRLNGEEEAVTAEPSSYLTLQRTWRDGDRVDVALPMSLHLHRMPDNPRHVAVMYGPLVLAGELGREGAAADSGPDLAPDIVTENEAPSDWIRPSIGTALTFYTVGVGRPGDVTLVPFHTLFDRPYAIYWRLSTEEEWLAREAERKRRAEREAAERREFLARVVDSVEIGDAASEREHNLQGERSSAGTHRGRAWRHAVGGGWFSYDLKVLSDAPVLLWCSYWGSDMGRVFRIYIDDTQVAEQTLARNQPDEFFSVEYKLAAALTRGKERVTVKFEGKDGSTAGGAFGCAIVKPE